MGGRKIPFGRGSHIRSSVRQHPGTRLPSSNYWI
jgi:hypothetical protein